MTDIFTPFEKAVIAEQADPQPANPANGRRGKRGPRRAKAAAPAKPTKQRRQRRPPADRHVVQDAAEPLRASHIIAALDGVYPSDIPTLTEVLKSLEPAPEDSRGRIMSALNRLFA